MVRAGALPISLACCRMLTSCFQNVLSSHEAAGNQLAPLCNGFGELRGDVINACLSEMAIGSAGSILAIDSLEEAAERLIHPKVADRLRTAWTQRQGTVLVLSRMRTRWLAAGRDGRSGCPVATLTRRHRRVTRGTVYVDGNHWLLLELSLDKQSSLVFDSLGSVNVLGKVRNRLGQLFERCDIAPTTVSSLLTSSTSSVPPLTALTGKDSVFGWGHVEESTFESLNKFLADALPLHRPGMDCVINAKKNADGSTWLCPANHYHRPLVATSAA
jgi:hypothetical protein